MVRLTNLEETLFADETGEHRDRLINLLLASLAVKGGGASEPVRLAADAAREVIEILWSRYHGDGGYVACAGRQLRKPY